MGKFIFLAVALLFLSYLNAQAQSPATGCLLPNNQVYTDDWATGSDYYRTSSYNILPTNHCSWIPNSGPICYVAASRSFNIFCWCYVYSSPQTGIKGTFTSLACPIDDYVAWLLLPIGIFGFFRFRNQRFAIADQT